MMEFKFKNAVWQVHKSAGYFNTSEPMPAECMAESVVSVQSMAIVGGQAELYFKSFLVFFFELLKGSLKYNEWCIMHIYI